ncbi:MAG TPA: carbamoyltransferase HypF [Candidatus Nitrosotalea sp.]|nr:carbamoyltransferase HypF [Candidatus Nitrosotalea sp.]
MSVVTARRITVEGVVQGVGFRPFVYALAARHGLAGWVRNTSSAVEIEVEGPPGAIEAFVDDLRDERPRLAHIERLREADALPQGRDAFEIEQSLEGDGFQPVSPDIATCPECLREIMDPRDRRSGYAFTNCTDCGPRFTIIRAVPYDRCNTTMAGFTMCPRCRAEYDDPGDRRFHAQPNACPDCGPRLTLLDGSGDPRPGDPLREACRLLVSGRVVAIKGIGGFHLACDATNDAAVSRLRERKGREAKPLALMVADVREAERLCVISTEERRLLASTARPIVLLRVRQGSGIAPSVAPGLGRLGVMLPYSPLHHLLFKAAAGTLPALVMTSGNRSEEPIATDDADALDRLSGVGDAFLLHDRPIHVRCDDSVTRVAAGVEVPIRRSRGYAPFPVRLPFESRPVLAVGAELKSAVCVTRGPYAFMSPHIGDLENLETYVSYQGMVERMAELFRVQPVALAHDLHPDYLSTRYALGLNPALPRVAVQHHHAHVAACMAEHRLTGPVIGVAFDGAGYGPDGAVWGGEFLVADYTGFERVGHLGYVPMPGGDRAAREPFRMALAHLVRTFGDWDPRWPPAREASETERGMIRWQIEHEVNAPLTSSMGRLFDAVASLAGVRHRARFEAQAAMELEALAEGLAGAPYQVEIAGGAPFVLEPGPMIRGVVDDLAEGAPPTRIAARFHATVAEAVVRVSERVRASRGLDRVVLTGGVFQNAILLGATRQGLEACAFEVFSHHLVPPNDGGIALGQAAVAHARLQSA